MPKEPTLIHFTAALSSYRGLRDGEIEQQGAPLDLFEQPAVLFVADFLGSSKMSFLKGQLARMAEKICIHLDDRRNVELPRGKASQLSDGTPIILGLRPEHVAPATARKPDPGVVRVEVVIDLVQPTGSRTYATFRATEQPLVAELQAFSVSRAGERIAIYINVPAGRCFRSADRYVIVRPTVDRTGNKGTKPVVHRQGGRRSTSDANLWSAVLSQQSSSGPSKAKQHKPGRNEHGRAVSQDIRGE